MLIRKFFIVTASIVVLAFSVASQADWFTSSKFEEELKKADAGDAEAQFGVGSGYDFGEGTRRNPELAIKYYTMAAEQGFIEAQNSLGSGYEAEGDYIQAASWYAKAADRGHPLAMNSVAIYYIQGIGVPKDIKKGLAYYEQVANHGFANAMYNLGMVYFSGEIVDKDVPKSCIWFVHAQKYAGKYQRVIDATKQARAVIEKQLTKEELAKCDEEGSSWVPLLKANQ